MDEGGRDILRYDAVLVTTPPAQAIPLLAAAPALARRTGAVKMAPCWAVMAVFAATLDISVDGSFVGEGPLSWIARNTSKPGRPEHEAWVLHGSPEWSAANLELEADEAGDLLLASFFEAIGHSPIRPVFCQAHRWRFSLAENPFTEGCLWDDEATIGACGDWCQGSRIEGAFLSGMAGAGRVLGATVRRGSKCL
jgi:predicted NAD/FAD-dependent oxidoreductase